MTTIIYFLLAYGLMIAAGTLGVSGWFFITRGSYELLPDGSKLHKGKIFRSWYFFWTQELEKKRQVYYQGPQLRTLAQDLSRSIKGQLLIHRGTIEVPYYRDNHPALQKLEEELEIHFVFKGYNLDTEHQGIYAIYKEYAQFRFPEWVRHPLAQCATCFSSLYGSLFYWGLILFFGPDLYSWARLPILAELFFWVAYCFSLAVTLTAVAKKYN